MADTASAGLASVFFDRVGKHVSYAFHLNHAPAVPVCRLRLRTAAAHESSGSRLISR